MLGLGLGIFKNAFIKATKFLFGEYFYDFSEQNTNGFTGAGEGEDVISDYLTASGTSTNYFSTIVSPSGSSTIKKYEVEFYIPSNIVNTAGYQCLFSDENDFSRLTIADAGGPSGEILTLKVSGGWYYITTPTTLTAGTHTLVIEWTGSTYNFTLDGTTTAATSYLSPVQATINNDILHIMKRYGGSGNLTAGSYVSSLKITDSSDNIILNFLNKYGANGTTYQWDGFTFTRYVGDATKRVTTSVPSQYRIENTGTTKSNNNYVDYTIYNGHDSQISFTAGVVSEFIAKGTFVLNNYTNEHEFTVCWASGSNDAFIVKLRPAVNEFYFATYATGGGGDFLLSSGVVDLALNVLYSFEAYANYSTGKKYFKIGNKIVAYHTISSLGTGTIGRNTPPNINIGKSILSLELYYDGVLSHSWVNNDSVATEGYVDSITSTTTPAPSNQNGLKPYPSPFNLSPFTGVAADFDGTAYISLPATVAAFDELHNTIGRGQFIFAEVEITTNAYSIIYESESNAGALLHLDNGLTNLSILYAPRGSSKGILQSDEVLEVGNTYKICCTYNGVNTAKIFVNGVQVADNGTSITNTATTNADDAPYIGGRAASNTHVGMISNVILGIQELADTQVAQLAIRPELTKNYLVNTVGIDWANVVAFYPLTEGGGDIAYDLSDNKNHGTWTNPAYVTGLSKGRQLGLQNVSRYDIGVYGNDFGYVLPHNATLNAGGVGTIYCTFKADANFVSGDNLFSKGTQSMRVYLSSGILSFRPNQVDTGGTGVLYTTSPTTYTDGELHEIFWSFNGTTHIIVIDGVEVFNGTFTYAVADNSDALALANWAAGARSLTGCIFEFRKYNEVITYSEAINDTPTDYDCVIWVKNTGKNELIDLSGNGNNFTTIGTPETITLPEVETIANIPYDTFGLECNSQNIIVTDGEVEETFVLRGNGNLRYDGHAGAYINIKQIQFWFNPQDNTDIEYLMMDEENNRIIYLEGNQIKSDFTLAATYVDDVETDVVINNTWQLISIEFTVPVDFEEFVFGSDMVGTPGTFSEFGMDKLNIFKDAVGWQDVVWTDLSSGITAIGSNLSSSGIPVGYGSGGSNGVALTGDFTIEFQTNASAYNYFGLDTLPNVINAYQAGPPVDGFDFGIFINTSSMASIKDGVFRSNFYSGVILSTDVWKVKRVGSTVSIYKEDLLIYTFPETTSDALYIKANRYSGNVTNYIFNVRYYLQ